VVLEKFPWTAEKNAYFVAVGGIFCSVKSIWSIVYFNSDVSLSFGEFFSLNDLSLRESDVLKQSTIMLCFKVYQSLMSVVFVLWNGLHQYSIINVYSCMSSSPFTFIYIRWPSLSLLINFGLTLSVLSIATPAYLWIPFS
jgi:hypothetical protein